MDEYTTGQRWVSDTETELGLGTIVEISGRTITILFPASGEKRAYATHNAPLTRVAFTAGEKVLSQTGSILFVQDVTESEGLLTYSGINDEGEEQHLHESQLESNQVFSRPQERLLRGQLDHPRWFKLRYETNLHAQRLAQSDTHGLTGIRAELLPHQLYIAHEVATRANPRVLLADEVGLGKTIEAAMILHHQLLTGRAERVLILVPEPLLHQWLVELLRRFNLSFKIFDEERCLAIEESNPDINPFLTEQLVLTSLNLFLNNPTRHTQALNGSWDTMVVDEAHHLAWEEGKPSIEYQAVEQLTQTTPGVLLLTATPEQLGKSGHFARLRLLDPDRFHDLKLFEKEEQHFAPVADAVEILLKPDVDHLQVKPLLVSLKDPEILSLFDELESLDKDSGKYDKTLTQIIHELIDRHGTGRVLFRNTRAKISGFPSRQVHAYPLQLPQPYLIEAESEKDPTHYLQPEEHYRSTSNAEQPNWSEFDPRLPWLSQLVRQLDGKKILLICAKAQTAIELEEYMRTREGILSGVFHEHMSIVERDRAAAWFADPDEGTPLLICSEIGSEGRNFQFSQHLVLFDLPMNPDLLEQRIGRLDRIGQLNTINIHVPYFEDSATSIMFQWYQDGLNAFESTCPEGHNVFKKLEPALRQALKDPEPSQTEILISSARELASKTHEQLEKGRDHLLELSSCRQPQADQLVEHIIENEYIDELTRYIDQLSNCYGLDLEDHSANSYILRPSAQMSVDHFPALPAEGMTATTHRTTALTHENWRFLSWEHPLVRGAMDLTLSGTHGRTGMLAAKPENGLNGLFLECVYILEAVGPKGLQAGKFMPPTCLRLFLNSKGEDQSTQVSFELLEQTAIHLEKKTLHNLLKKSRPVIPGLLEKAESLSQNLAQPIRQLAIDNMLDFYTNEIQRLTQLQSINPLVRDDEIEDIQAEGLALHRMLESSQLRLDAVRVVILA